MTRYFFDFQDGSESTVDDHGVELTSLHEARAEATKALAEVAREILPDDGCEHEFSIVVREGERPVLLTKLSFEAVPLSG
jgi:hypothetical protein